jgi:hypothetical protein
MLQFDAKASRRVEATYTTPDVAWEQHLVDPHLPRRLRGWLGRAGFQVAPPQVVPLCNVGFDPATYSAGLLDFVAGFVVGRDGLTAEEVQAWAADLRSLGTDAFFSLNPYLFCAMEHRRGPGQVRRVGSDIASGSVTTTGLPEGLPTLARLPRFTPTSAG